MSATVDVNVLVHARNQDSPDHAAAKDLVERLAVGPAVLYLFWPAIMGFIRIATNSRILPSPISPGAARRWIDALIELPHVRTPGEGRDFWDRFVELADPGIRASLVPDAHIVALMHENGVRTIHTLDRGFARFEGIKVRGLD